MATPGGERTGVPNGGGDTVEVSDRDSFPASDAPSWTGAVADTAAHADASALPGDHPDAPGPFAHIDGATVTARFSVRRVQRLDAKGRAVNALPLLALDEAVLHGLYRSMVRARVFDAKAVALQRTGRLGTYPPLVGEEAVGVGVAYAMAPDDVLVPGFREQAAQLDRGVTPLELLRYWAGDERGSDFAGPRRDFPISIPIASHAPHAAGIALAMKLRAPGQVAVCLLGDGATSKGDFAEALNIAGVLTLPLVFVVADNEWAISVPRSAQTAAQTIAQKAIAAGVPCIQVDGNDVIAVAEVASRAVEYAREGRGPSVIEALTYRLGDHTTVDDAHRYRPDSEVSARWAEEPIRRLRAYLVEAGTWGREQEERLLQDLTEEIASAADALERCAPEPPAAMFDHLYAELPDLLRDQYDEVVARAGR